MDFSVTRRAAIGPSDAGRTLADAPGRNGESGCVLVVDDDPAIRLLCAVNLSVAGMRVLEAADGLEGLEQARCEKPDLVLTDVRMPGLDGFQLAARLRRDERTRHIPLIFLSGEVEQENVERARGLRALAYVTKPFDPLALAALVGHEFAAARAPRPGLAATVTDHAIEDQRSATRRRSDATRIPSRANGAAQRTCRAAPRTAP